VEAAALAKPEVMVLLRNLGQVEMVLNLLLQELRHITLVEAVVAQDQTPLLLRLESVVSAEVEMADAAKIQEAQEHPTLEAEAEEKELAAQMEALELVALEAQA
jgi:hypothetical protein